MPVWLAAAAFRRLCVETYVGKGKFKKVPQPPSGGCVLKQNHVNNHSSLASSRLQAAVC